MNKYSFTLVFVCLFGLSLMAQESEANAAETDEPKFQATMTVTAEKREEKLVDVPLSISVMEAKQMEEAGVERVKEVSYYIPNLFFGELSAKRVNTAHIRGVGAGQGEPAVTTLIDGVPQLTSASTNLEFLDLDRVEVLRGPQGSLYGRNTIGGVVNLITAGPSDAFHALAELQTGSDSLQRLKVSLAGPIVEGKAWYRVGGSFYKRDGFTENLARPDSDKGVDWQDTTFGRLQLFFKPTSDWDIALTGYAQNDDDGGFVLVDQPFLETMPFQLYNDYIGSSARDVTSTSAKVTYHATLFDLTSITAIDNNDVEEYTDLDFLPVDLLRRRTAEDHEQFYQEFRLNSPQQVEIGGMALNWVAGLSYFSADFNHDAYTELRPNITQSADSLFYNEYYDLSDSGYALFGQATLTVGESLDFTGGLRYEKEKKEWDVNLSQVFGIYPLLVTQGADDANYDELLPKIGLAYRFSDRFSIFANAAKSYRSGGYNRNTAATSDGYSSDLYTYDAETAWSYELGLKRAWLDDRIYLAATIFTMDWKNRQLSIPIPGVTGQYYQDNVAKSTSEGIELDLTAVLNEYFDLRAGLGTTGAEFGTYLDPSSGTDVNGNSLPLVPEENHYLALDAHLTQGKLTWHANLGWTSMGDLWFDAANTAGEGQVDLLNARVGVRWKSLSFEIWGRNLTDEEYLHSGIPHTILPNTWAVVPGSPKETGLTLGYRY